MSISQTELALILVFSILLITLMYYLIKSIVSASDHRETGGWVSLICAYIGIISLLGINMQAIGSSTALELILVVLMASFAIAAVYLHTTSSTSPLSP